MIDGYLVVLFHLVFIKYRLLMDINYIQCNERLLKPYFFFSYAKVDLIHTIITIN